MKQPDEIFDAFAELGLPRRVALSDSEIEEAWRSLSKRWHPDAPEGDSTRSAILQRAYAVLARPGARLRHWLELHGRKTKGAAMSDTTMALFTKVGAALQSADELLRRKSSATTALGRAILAPQEWRMQSALQELLTEINAAIAKAIAVLPQLDREELEDDRLPARSLADRILRPTEKIVKPAAVVSDRNRSKIDRVLALALAESTAADLGFLEKWQSQVRDHLLAFLS